MVEGGVEGICWVFVLSLSTALAVIQWLMTGVVDMNGTHSYGSRYYLQLATKPIPKSKSFVWWREPFVAWAVPLDRLAVSVELVFKLFHANGI